MVGKGRGREQRGRDLPHQWQTAATKPTSTFCLRLFRGVKTTVFALKGLIFNYIIQENNIRTALFAGKKGTILCNFFVTLQ